MWKSSEDPLGLMSKSQKVKVSCFTKCIVCVDMSVKLVNYCCNLPSWWINKLINYFMLHYYLAKMSALVKFLIFSSKCIYFSSEKCKARVCACGTDYCALAAQRHCSWTQLRKGFWERQDGGTVKRRADGPKIWQNNASAIIGKMNRGRGPVRSDSSVAISPSELRPNRLRRKSRLSQVEAPELGLSQNQQRTAGLSHVSVNKCKQLRKLDLICEYLVNITKRFPVWE